jgi:endonuclease/exonuclease/phosphatase family metal-dependent hydrolase
MNHTHSKLTVSTLAAFSSLCIATIAGLAAGQAGTPRTTIADLPMGEVSKAKILLDGDVSDWSQESAVTADANYLYFRFSFGEGTFTLQHAPKPVLVMVDIDADAKTGINPSASGLKTMGVDLQIEFSATPKKGVTASTVDSTGKRTAINPYDLDVVVAPTVAAPWYEGRISRNSPAIANLPMKGLRSSGKATIAVGMANEQGKLGAYSDPETITLPMAAKASRGADALPPTKPKTAVRVMTWNIERSAPVKNPQPFRRVIQAVQPDVILFQEWETGSATDVLAWMTQWISSENEWHVIKAAGSLNDGGGVAVVSRYEIAPQLSSPPLGGQGGTPVRFVSAKVAAPFGDMLVGSTHLKCCGYKDSPEDQKRVSEAETINKAFLFEGAPAYRVITGDMNLVGSMPPLERLAAGLDLDGSALMPASAKVLGDATMVTWAKSGDTFGPGRLDYVLYSDASLEAINSFILDTRKLSDEALARLGLEREDSSASDHMPVIVDFQVK